MLNGLCSFRLAVLIAVLACALIPTTKLAATEPLKIINTIDASLNLDLPDTIFIDTPFKLTFSIKVNQPVAHFNDQPDKISILIPQCCQVDSGGTKWYGRLDKDSSVSMTVIVRATRSCRDFFAAIVKTGSLRHNTSMFHTSNSIRSRNYGIGDSTKYLVGDQLDSGDVQIMAIPALGPPPSIAQGKVRVQGLEVANPSPPEEREKPGISKPQNQIKVSLDSLVGGNAKLKYVRGCTNYLIVYTPGNTLNSSKRLLLPVCWRFDSPGCTIYQPSATTTILVIDEELDRVGLQFDVEDHAVNTIIELQ